MHVNLNGGLRSIKTKWWNYWNRCTLKRRSINSFSVILLFAISTFSMTVHVQLICQSFSLLKIYRIPLFNSWTEKTFYFLLKTGIVHSLKIISELQLFISTIFTSLSTLQVWSEFWPCKFSGCELIKLIATLNFFYLDRFTHKCIKVSITLHQCSSICICAIAADCDGSIPPTKTMLTTEIFLFIHLTWQTGLHFTAQLRAKTGNPSPQKARIVASQRLEPWRGILNYDMPKSRVGCLENYVRRR